MEVVLKNVRHGTGARRKFIYADLYEKESGFLYMGATLDYCIQAVNDRGLTLVTEPR